LTTSVSFEQIRGLLPLEITGYTVDDYFFQVSGNDWALSVSGEWRLTLAGAIEASSHSAEGTPYGNPSTVVGTQVVDVGPQSRFNALDIAVRLADGRVLETFSAHYYGCWRLTARQHAIDVEGPMQAGPS
jgi:hypothetical protein